ncbi:hypothetical protein M0R19_02810 [Candidatus Pacearchaeota archaeon]|jgi:hypothetical protein|nr:hypothetical protein [Candidatus Pacearchaeota archaeon]
MENPIVKEEGILDRYIGEYVRIKYNGDECWGKVDEIKDGFIFLKPYVEWEHSSEHNLEIRKFFESKSMAINGLEKGTRIIPSTREKLDEWISVYNKDAIKKKKETNQKIK